MKARVKYGVSGSNRSPDNTTASPCDERTTTPAYTGHHIRAKRPEAFCLIKGDQEVL